MASYYEPYKSHSPGVSAGGSSAIRGEFRPSKGRRSLLDDLLEGEFKPKPRDRKVTPRRLSPTGARAAARATAARAAATVVTTAARTTPAGKAATALLVLAGYTPELEGEPELLPPEEWPWVLQSGWYEVTCGAYFGGPAVGWRHAATSLPPCAPNAATSLTMTTATWAANLAAVNTPNPNPAPGAHTLRVRYRDVPSPGFVRAYQSGGWKSTTGAAPGPFAQEPAYGPAPEPIPPSWTWAENRPVAVTVRKLTFAPFASPREYAIDIVTGRNPHVRIVPWPRAQRPGRAGTKNTHYGRKAPYREKKATMSGPYAAFMKGIFWLHETVDDVMDWWEILMESLPREVRAMTFAEQLAWFSDVRNWGDIDVAGFVDGLIRWYATEMFYGRFIGGLEDRIALDIGASSKYGVGVVTRGMADDPVNTFISWLTSS